MYHTLKKGFDQDVQFAELVPQDDAEDNAALLPMPVNDAEDDALPEEVLKDFLDGNLLDGDGNLLDGDLFDLQEVLPNNTTERVFEQLSAAPPLENQPAHTNADILRLACRLSQANLS